MFYFSTANGAMIPFSYLHFESTSNGEIGSEYTSIEDEESSASDDGQDTENHQTNSSNSPRLNLNMCSAWTVRRSTHICSSCVQFLLLCAILTMIHSLSFYSMSLLTLLGAPRSLLQDQYPSFSKQSLLILPMLGLRLVYHSLFVSVPSPWLKALWAQRLKSDVWEQSFKRNVFKWLHKFSIAVNCLTILTVAKASKLK